MKRLLVGIPSLILPFVVAVALILPRGVMAAPQDAGDMAAEKDYLKPHIPDRPASSLIEMKPDSD